MDWDYRGINFCACSSGRLEEFAEGLGMAATEMSAELKDRAGELGRFASATSSRQVFRNSI